MRKSWIVPRGLVALLTACASVTPAAPATVPALDGTSWTVSQLNGKATVEGHPPTMRFADGRVGGTTGCNTFSTGYTQDGARLTFGKDVAMTAMACTDEAVTAQEQAVTTALGTVAGVRQAGTGLELVDAGQSVVFYRGDECLGGGIIESASFRGEARGLVDRPPATMAMLA